MKLSNANELRAKVLNELMTYFATAEEDVGQISSHELNFPVAINGEEGWVEISVKIPKDDSDEGYLKRDSYIIAVKEKKEKAAAKQAAKEKKIAADTKRREEKKAALAAAAGK